MKKVLFISNLNYSKNFIPNGVNIKNEHILKYLKKIDNYKISVINTNFWKKKFIILIFKLLFMPFFFDNIIISINSNSAYKLLSYFKKMGLSKKVIYIVVGGSLTKSILNNKYDKENYIDLKAIFFQSKIMVKDMQSIGFDNVLYLPNSKYFNKIKINKMENPSLPLRMFYLGRIHPDKGINMIFESINLINSKEVKIYIDFFGPIDKKYKNKFESEISKHEYFKYKGVTDFIKNDDNYVMLSKYAFFIFPTFWEGEGFPGVVIDSFISGVPVIASDWNYNKEIITDGYNGYIFEAKNIKSLIKELEFVTKNICDIPILKKNALLSADNYHSNNVLDKIKQFIN